MSVHFDTLEFVKTLTSAGVSQPHAEAMARAHAKSMGDVVTNDIASKADVAVLRAEMKTLRAEMKADVDVLRAEIKSSADTLRAEYKAGNDALRAEPKSDIAGLRSELKADFQTELRSLKYAAMMATGFLSLIVVLVRFIH